MWTCPNCKREFKNKNQSHYCGKAPATVDEYISRQEDAIRPLLSLIKDAIHSAIPEAEETISWGMPTWKKNKANVIHFAANKNHIGLYVGQEALAFFEDRLEGLDADKGTIRLKTDRELPTDLISDIAKWCYETTQNS